MTGVDLRSLEGRSVMALHEALQEVGAVPDWKRQVARIMLMHVASELIVLEQQAGHPCTLQDACAYLCHGAEGRA